MKPKTFLFQKVGQYDPKKDAKNYYNGEFLLIQEIGNKQCLVDAQNDVIIEADVICRRHDYIICYTYIKYPKIKRLQIYKDEDLETPFFEKIVTSEYDALYHRHYVELGLERI